MIDVSPEILAGVAGIIFSLVFAYIPGATEWFEALSVQTKRRFMLGLSALAAVLVIGNECRVVAECYATNWEVFVGALIASAVSNQTAYALVSKGSARAAKANAAARAARRGKAK